MNSGLLKKIILLIMVALLGYLGHAWQTPAASPTPNVAVRTAAEAPNDVLQNEDFAVTPSRRQHILYGNETGGGHRFGAGKPGKTEFPQSWDDEKIIAAALQLANDKNMPMRPSGRYWLKAGVVDGVMMRVVLDRDKGEVVTAYPLNKDRKNE